MRRVPQAAREPEGGAAYVEVLLAFLPLFTLFMGLLQISILYSVRLLTQHAATRAARTASVVLDDDPRWYAGEERGAVTGAHVAAAELAQAYRRHAGAGSGAWPMSRRATIETSAMLPLLATMPRDPTGQGRADEVSLTERAANLRERVRVEILHAATGGGAVRVGDEDVRVRVTFAYPCAIPFAGRLVCSGGRSTVVAEATLHNHRAEYPYLEEDAP